MGGAGEKSFEPEEVFEVDEGLIEGEDIEVLPTDDDEETEGQHLRFRVGTNLKFRRLDKYLCGRFSHFSRSRLQKLIKEQGVNVNGHPAKPSHKLNPRDEIDLILPPREIRELVAEDIPLDILYEDEDLIVVNKQANLIVHPARGYKSGTLVNGLMYHANSLSTGSNEYRPGIVHRLDKNTTGVIVAAKTDHAHWKLSRQFAERTTRKTYLAIVHGVPELTADCINLPMGVHPHHREKCAIRADGKEAITFYEVLEEFRVLRQKLSPKTGDAPVAGAHGASEASDRGGRHVRGQGGLRLAGGGPRGRRCGANYRKACAACVATGDPASDDEGDDDVRGAAAGGYAVAVGEASGVSAGVRTAGEIDCWGLAVG